MSVPFEVLLTLALGLLTALVSIVFAVRLSSQLKEAEARLLNEVAAREKAARLLEEQEAAKVRLLEDHETATKRLANERETEVTRVAEARDEQRARAEAAEKGLAGAREELSSLRAELSALSLESERKGDALSLAKAAEAAALAKGRELSEKVAALSAQLEEKTREINASRELTATARTQVKGAEAELRRTADHLEASQREAKALGELASRLEKQLFDALATSKLEKQLMDTLGALQASGAELSRALHKAEQDAWREKTAKEALLLEARSLREDVKRVQVRLAGELARREELARQWAEASAALASSSDGAEEAAPAPEKRPDEFVELAKAMAPPQPVEAPVSVPAAARQGRTRTVTPPGKRAATAKAEEPKKIESWWCQICGRGGTQLATACKHQWKGNEMI